jgi:hypothetical protein
MSRAPGPRGALWIWIVVVGSASQVGCIHNHYYGTVPTTAGCPPAGSTVTTQVGSLCDVPSGRIVVSNPSSNAAVASSDAGSATLTASAASSAGASRIVISQPAQGPPSIGQSSGRIKWRKPDPETIPTMKAEGGLDDSISR